MRLGLAFVLSLGCAVYITVSWRWMMILDSPIMHYVNFLVGRGFQPYRDISDNNLPGAYITEWLAVHLFGSGDVGWRCYEFALLAALTVGLAIVSGPKNRIAGVFAGLTFVLVHGAEGPALAGERELLMTVLLVYAVAALFAAIQKQQPLWMLPMGFLAGFATSIKPTIAPLFLVYVATAIWTARSRRTSPVVPAAWAILGAAIAAAVNVLYLVVHHAWHDFFVVQRLTTLAYANIANPSWTTLTRFLFSNHPLQPLVAAGLALAVVQRRWSWEQWVLLATVAIGLLSYYAQRKAFVHHLYLVVVPLLLLVWMEVVKGLREARRHRWLAMGCVLYTAFVVVPLNVWRICRTNPVSNLTLAMVRDLSVLGGPERLQGRVQCLDLTYGCLNALYREKIVGNTGFTGDLMVFNPQSNPAVERERARWWQASQRHPADVLLMTNQYFQGNNTYAKTENWPAYARLIDRDYVLAAQREFPEEYAPLYRFPKGQEMGYRVYLRKGFAAPHLD